MTRDEFRRAYSFVRYYRNMTTGPRTAREGNRVGEIGTAYAVLASRCLVNRERASDRQKHEDRIRLLQEHRQPLIISLTLAMFHDRACWRRPLTLP